MTDFIWAVTRVKSAPILEEPTQPQWLDDAGAPRE